MRTATGVEPKTICPPFWRISEMPSVTTSWPKWPSSSEPTVRRPDTREMRNRWRIAPPAKTAGAAHIAPMNGPQYGPRKARIRPSLTR